MLAANIEDGPRGPSSKHSLWLLSCRKCMEEAFLTCVGLLMGP